MDGVNENEGAAACSGPGTSLVPSKRNQMEGPCYLKMLVNNLVAGSIIGKSGAVIASIERETGCVLKLSPAHNYYPGTQDRVVALSGQQEEIERAVAIIMEKNREVASQYGYDSTTAQQPSKLTCKLVVPKSAVSSIIGKEGQQVKQLQERTGARIQVSSREEGLNERTVNISGAFEALQSAVQSVSSCIQCDANLKDHMHVVYNKNAFGTGGGRPMGGGSFSQYGMGGGMGQGNGQYGGGMGMGQQNGQYGFMGQQNGQYGHYGGEVGGQSDMQSPPCEIFMQVPDQLVGAVVGKNKMFLHEITSLSGARINVSQKGELIPGTNDRKLVITGGIGAVHYAHFLLIQRVAAAQNQQSQLSKGPRPNQSAGGGVGANNPTQTQSGMAMNSSVGQYPQQMQSTYGY